MKLERYRDKAGRWRWRATAANGNVIGASEQGYRSKWWAGQKARRAHPDVALTDVEGP
jgi:uncharacterized protein YegP (UPF0339 family)